MQGFGGAITDSSATVLYRLSPAARAATMRSLFDPVTGDGLDYLRQPIGASDFVATADYTYDDLPAGQTDYAQKHFSIAHDQAQILPLLRQAEAINPRLQIIASPWSPPAWMKTNDSLIGGRLIDDPRIYRSYALYLLKFVQAYRANGVTRRTRSRCRTSRRTAPPPATRAPTCPRPRRRRSSRTSGRCCAPRACAPRSSPTTTTGPNTPTTSRPPRRTRPPTSTPTRRTC